MKALVSKSFEILVNFKVMSNEMTKLMTKINKLAVSKNLLFVSGHASLK